MRRSPLFLMLAAPLLAAGCDGVTESDGAARSPVAVRFAVDRAAAAVAPAGAAIAPPAANQLAVGGSNGTLAITDLRLVVAEFELDGEDDGRSCTGDDCEDFNSAPSFVQLSLGGGPVTVTTAPIPAGTYRELEFEIEDLDDDEENATERQQIEQLLQQIRAQFPDWPREASVRVSGTFTPAGGAARPFVTYVEAEIEIETPLVPPLVVGEGGASQTVSVTLDPAAWFRGADGRVIDLSAWDHGSTGRLLEIELEDGFRSGSGSGDDDDDDDDDD